MVPGMKGKGHSALELWAKFEKDHDFNALIIAYRSGNETVELVADRFFKALEKEAPGDRGLLQKCFQAVTQIENPNEAKKACIAVFRAFFPTLYTRTDKETEQIVMQMVLEAEPGEGADVLARASPLLEGVQFGPDRVEVLRAIHEIPARERADVLARASPLLEGVQGWVACTEILRAVREIPERERADVFKRASPLLAGVQDGWARLKILKEARKNLAR